jgi:hypothetical protein
MTLFNWSGPSPARAEHILEAIGRKLRTLYDIEELQRPTDRLSELLRQIGENDRKIDLGH